MAKPRTERCGVFLFLKTITYLEFLRFSTEIGRFDEVDLENAELVGSKTAEMKAGP